MAPKTAQRKTKITPSYPKEFFQQCPFEKERRRVFVLMPFNKPHSDKLYESLTHVCDIHSFIPYRADLPEHAGDVKADILEHLAKADVIIADLTGENANVFYELGLAHMLFDCERVICVVQRTPNLRVPFHVQAFRYLKFDTENPEVQTRFEVQLGNILAHLRIDPPGVIGDCLERTKQLVRDMQELARRDPDDLQREAVRYAGGLSAFAINKDEPWDCPPEKKTYYGEYQEWLIKEKEALRNLAAAGCRVYCIITLPERPHRDKRWQYLNARMQSLLRFLKSKDGMLDTIKFAVSPFRQQNQYIIGHVSCVDGYKGETQRGFPLSLRQTGRAAIDAKIDLFDTLFASMAEYTMKPNRTSPTRRREYSAEELRAALIHRLETTLALATPRKTRCRD